ncbi:hypothetical protein D3C79_781660 [compost metagenome]
MALNMNRRENSGQNTSPTSARAQIAVPTRNAAYSQAPAGLRRAISRPETAISKPPIRKYQEPPRLTSFTPPAASARPSRAMISPRPTRMNIEAPEVRGACFIPKKTRSGGVAELYP